MEDISPDEFVKRLKNKSKGEETKLQKSIQKYLNDIGAYCFKVHGSIYMRAGIPDIICCYKGQFFGIECKVRNNVLSDVQKEHRKEIINSGGTFIEARHLEDVTKIIK